MDASLFLNNLSSPPILFFILGLGAAWVRSDLEIPSPVAKLLSLYLLLAIGFQGGHKLVTGSPDLAAFVLLGVAVLSSFLVPVWSFFVLRPRVGVDNAAAIGATYGSISAVTFITAVSFLDAQAVPYGGHMVAAMALMESPAIVSGVLLHRVYAGRQGGGGGTVRWREVGREAFLNGAVVVLVGSMVIGIVSGEKGWQAVAPFLDAPFKGVLCLFLLDMGLVAGRRFGELKRGGLFLGGFALVAAVLHGLLGVAIARGLNTSPGDALLFAMLLGSASYIAVPAAMRLSIPSAEPSLYVPMSLAITFPFNVALGIPFYYWLIEYAWEVPS